MKIFSGILLLIISIIGTIYFRRYSGTVVPFPTLMFFAFLLLGMVGAWLIFSASYSTEKGLRAAHQSAQEKIRKNAVKIKLNFDLCEFKDRSFHQEVPDQTPALLNVMADASYNSPAKTEYASRSWLIYTMPDTSEKFTSRAFPLEATSLKASVLKGQVFLFIDRFDRQKYFFEIAEA